MQFFSFSYNYIKKENKTEMNHMNENKFFQLVITYVLNYIVVALWYNCTYKNATGLVIFEIDWPKRQLCSPAAVPTWALSHPLVVVSYFL